MGWPCHPQQWYFRYVVNPLNQLKSFKYSLHILQKCPEVLTSSTNQVLQERGESTSRHGRATFSVLLFQVQYMTFLGPFIVVTCFQNVRIYFWDDACRGFLGILDIWYLIWKTSISLNLRLPTLRKITGAETLCFSLPCQSWMYWLI